MILTLLLTVFRMVVLPVEFQDRTFAASREQQEALVKEAEAYFNRQFGATARPDGISSKAGAAGMEGMSFVFELGPAVTLQHGVARWTTSSC